jgi:hypothetical protein
MRGFLANNVLETMWKKEVVAVFKILYWHLNEGTVVSKAFKL